VVGASLVLKGELSGKEDLVVFGQVEGRILVPGHSVTIGPEGKVKAEIRASRVIVEGWVEGNINVPERVEIHKTGHVIGDLTAPGITIENGAFLRGKVEIIREVESRSGPSVAIVPPKESVV
jgi:cytoskeletal protein CcmA (bactofilin family)